MAMFRGTALRVVRTNASVVSRRMGSGGGGIPPPFARTLPPAEPLHEEHELIWDDGVAAEATIDFDAPFIGSSESIKLWLGGLFFFASIFGIVSLTGPTTQRTAVKRSTEGAELPHNNAHLARGRDPALQ